MSPVLEFSELLPHSGPLFPAGGLDIKPDAWSGRLDHATDDRVRIWPLGSPVAAQMRKY